MYDRVSLLDQITESILTNFHKEKNSAKIQCKFSLLKSSLRDNLFIFSLYSIFTAILCILAHLRSSKTFYIFTLPTSEIGEHRILPPIFTKQTRTTTIPSSVS